MNDHKFKLDDMPLIIRLLIFVAPLFMWVANLHFQAAANTNEITEMKAYLAKRRDVGEKMLERMGSLEAKVDVLLKRTQ